MILTAASKRPGEAPLRRLSPKSGTVVVARKK
ncbi:hypothetical protein ABH931_004961 [Streptacidiphilus sp. MAP12-33]|jgi:hypothetical protein